MLLDYRYPALVRARLKPSGAERNVLVTASGRLRVDDLSSADAPLAAVIEAEDLKVEYRWYEGRLYRRAPRGGQGTGDCGLDHHMALRIAHARDSMSARAASGIPDMVDRAADRAVRMRDNFVCFRGNSFTFPDRLLASLPQLGDVAVVDQGDVERWSDIARDHVERLVLVEGAMWMPAPEPLLAAVTRADGFIRLIDETIYDGKLGGARNMPAPFGRMAMPSTAFFSPDVRVYPIIDEIGCNRRAKKADSGSSDRGTRIDIHMPEAFLADNSERELDRMARAAICVSHDWATTAFNAGTIFQGRFPPAFRTAMKEARNALRDGPLDEDSGRALLSRLDCLLTWVSAADLASSSPDDIRLLSSLVKDAKDMWADREISLDVVIPDQARPLQPFRS